MWIIHKQIKYISDIIVAMSYSELLQFLGEFNILLAPKDTPDKTSPAHLPINRSPIPEEIIIKAPTSRTRAIE